MSRRLPALFLASLFMWLALSADPATAVPAGDPTVAEAEVAIEALELVRSEVPR